MRTAGTNSVAVLEKPSNDLGMVKVPYGLKGFWCLAGVSGHMTNDHFLVVHEVLAHTFIRPVVDELLECDIIRPVIWIVHQYGLLDVVSEVATLFDLCKPVMEGPTL